MVYIDYACGRAVGVGVEDTSLHSHGLQVEATPAAGRAGGGHWRAVNLTKTDCALPEPRTAPGYPTVKSHFQHHRCCMHATGSSGGGGGCPCNCATHGPWHPSAPAANSFSAMVRDTSGRVEVKRWFSWRACCVLDCPHQCSLCIAESARGSLRSKGAKPRIDSHRA